MFKGKTSNKLTLVLSEFWEQLFPKVQDADAIPKIVKRIEAWTDQQPALTEILCGYVLKYASQINEKDAGGIVDRIVQRDILNDWEHSDAAVHLNKISATINDYGQRDILLLLYMKIVQKGSVSARKSPEQEALIRSGLVIEKNAKLRVANRIYREIFNIDWVEQQMPGITRPVAIIETSAAESKRPSLKAGWYSKLAVAVCCLAVLGASVSAYLREASSQSALATQDPVESTVESVEAVPIQASTTADEGSPADKGSENTTAVTTPAAPEQLAADDQSNADRALYDQGIEHATNGRWLPMAREFCTLSESSTYFWTAEKQLEKWLELYPEEIAIAQETFKKESNAACPILTKAIENTAGQG